MRTSTKLSIGFSCAVLILLVVGLIGRSSLVVSGEHITAVGRNNLPSVYGLQRMLSGVLHVAAGQRGLIHSRMMDHETRSANYEEVSLGMRKIAEGRKIYEPLALQAEEIRLWTALGPRLEEWQRAVQSVVDTEREKDNLISGGAKLDDSRVVELDERAMEATRRTRQARNDTNRLLDELVELNNGYAKKEITESEASASRNVSLIVALMSLGALIAAALGLLISRSVNRAISVLREEAGRLTAAAVAGKLATRADVMSVPAEFRGIVQGVNDTLDAVISPLNVAAEYVDEIAKGRIPQSITENYNGDFNVIKNNLNKLIGSLNLLIDEMANMSKQHDAGDIDVKIPEERFEGAYRTVAKGVNDMVMGHINVKKKAMACIAEFAAGNFDAPLERFPGKKVFINENVELLRRNSKALIEDANLLANAAVEGKLATRADATKHQGDYRKIVQGVNNTLDAVIGPLNVAANYVDRISKGDIPHKITDSYNGDFNTIKNNLNQCIDAVNRMVGDANVLAKAAVEGKLATRADATKHDGEFRRIVQGVNDTLDAVIGPLNVAAEYVDKISRGNIPAKITDAYNGDFNTIKNNLNRCVDAVNALVADANMLAVAAIDGKLATRAEASKHEGDFRKIVDGVNKTLDAVITPVMEATVALEKLAHYDLRARVMGDYRGDHARIKDALNGTAKALQDALVQVADAVEQVAEASQQIAGSSQAVSQGASEQASSLEETSSSLEQMAGMTKQNADNTIQARSLAQTTKEAAEKGGTAMTRMTDAMEKIRAASEGTAEIIKDINDIAFQTNLLALNAAVEAARAGDAGRGFAVVAEEVRNLALRSKEAAKKTEDLIKVAVGHAENGRVITNEVAGSLTEIVTAAAKVNDIVSEIAVASQEQSRGIEQVNKAVSEMDKVVQTAASNAEESSSAAEELASQSEELSTLVQRFELDRERAGRRQLGNSVKEGGALRRAGKRPGTVPPPRRGNLGARSTVKKPYETTNARKPTPEELIPLEEDADFQDF